MSITLYNKNIGGVSIDCFVRERHSSDIDIIENPVESGFSVVDHAVIKPKMLDLEIATYQPVETFRKLVALQESRIPFSVITGLAVYDNMLIKSIPVDRNADNTFILNSVISLQEVIITNVAYYTVDTEESGNKHGSSGGVKSTKAASPSEKPSNKKGIDGVKTSEKTKGTLERGDVSGKKENTSILQEIFF